MSKRTLARKTLATTGTCLLLLGLAACEDSSTGPDGFLSDLCLPCYYGDGDPPRSLPPLEIVTTSLPDAPLNFAYSQRIVATGGSPYTASTWSVTLGSIPTGLTLASDGHITGTPTELGTFKFTAQVTKDYEPLQQALSITVGAVVVLQPSELCSDHPAIAIASFEDADLEAAIRTRLGFGTQEALTCSMLGALTVLMADDAGIDSLVGIQNLTGLLELNFDNNSITDIGPLSGLTSLTTLNLQSNRITDLSALSGLTSLWTLHLDNNPNLSNIQPLLDNIGLGAGNYVILSGTNVSCTDVALLEAKGVRVTSDCP